MELLFVENERKLPDGFGTLIKNLEISFNYDFTNVKQILNFDSFTSKEKVQTLFPEDKKVGILTWSSYTYTHLNSAQTFINLMNFCTKNWIEDKLYIDGTGNLPKLIKSLFNDGKLTLRHCEMLNNNYIITRNEDFEFCRLKINVPDKNTDIFSFQQLDKDFFNTI